MKFKFKTQDYQQNAVENIAKVFNGQPYMDVRRYSRDLGISRNIIQTVDGTQEQLGMFEVDDSGFENAKLLLKDFELLENIKNIQRESNYKVSDCLIKNLGRCSLDVEMETGTGKTYVYIKSIFELNKRYGWSKFIIVVPSIAIREGVKKSFQMMEEHFMEQYGKKARYFIYNSKKLSELDSFASSSDINVMIINAQAFNARSADARRIDMVLDDFQTRRPIDVVAKTRPILIIDEPQKLGGEATQTSLKKFNPLFNINFSATHKKHHNLVYCLDAIDAYNKCLVKKIQVKGFELKNLLGTKSYMYLQDIVVSPNRAPMCKLEFEVRHKNSLSREIRLLGVGDNLYQKSNLMEQYKNGYTISEINPFNDTITFVNGEILCTGNAVGILDNDLRRIQIRETILSHIEKEESLFERNIKCLSLFFIDEVAKYRDYNASDERGEYAKMFEEEYIRIVNERMQADETPYIRYLKNIQPSDTHKGYFSVDKKSGKFVNSKDNKETGSDDISAYDLILKNKERLLSFNEPTRFIFSHSALREGWDNPNIFQICTLKHGGDSSIAKRQEIGRGLRISVNSFGERMDYNYCDNEKSIFHNINTLTVVTSDNYKNFVSDIQKEIKSNLADRPTLATAEYFEGKTISDGVKIIQVDKAMANYIFSFLLFSRYVDGTGRLTESYYTDKNQRNLKSMPDVLAPYENSIYKLVQSVFDEKILNGIIGDGKKSKINSNPLKDNFYEEPFKTLWKNINHKYTYRVLFDSTEVIKNAVASINERLFVARCKYIATTGEQESILDENRLNRGESFSVTKTKIEMTTMGDGQGVKYDLIGRVVDNTKLTRKTIVKILQGITAEKFGMFKNNPEDFISKVSKIINEQKASVIVEHITYNQTDGTYHNDIFTAGQSKADYSKAFRAKKAIQDYVFTDGLAEKSIERVFAEDLDNAEEVCVYAKLPRSFQIPTPVGSYAPDWAIAFNDGYGIKHIYFVAETKGTMDSLELRPIEQAKIKCAKKLFNELSTSRVRYHEVASYEDLLNVMKSIN